MSKKLAEADKRIMTGNSNPPSEPPKQEQGFRALIAKGTIGAVSLAGATAIPLMVQKYLGPSTPAASPTPSVPAQVAPAQMLPSQIQPQEGNQEQVNAEQDGEQSHKKKGKKKGWEKD